MAGQAHGLKPVQFRLPAWATEFLEVQAQTTGKTKTQVMIEAISCLRSRETEELMREGYVAMREWGRDLAEEGMAAGSETLLEW